MQLSFQPSTVITKRPTRSSEDTGPDQIKMVSVEKGLTVPDQVDTLIIGLVAMDTISKTAGKAVMGDSNPGKLTTSIGGVGYNVNFFYKSSVKTGSLKVSSRLVSAVGSDFAGKSILSKMTSSGEDTSGIYVLADKETAQYTASIDKNGELIVAVADMAIMEDSSWMDHITREINRAQPRYVIIDCNLLPKLLSHVVTQTKKLSLLPKIIIEPTSQPKLARISEMELKNLGIFPNNFIMLITPTSAELETIFSTFNTRKYFDDYDEWFPVLDALGIDANFREKLSALANKNELMAYLLKEGLLQQAFQLLPYTPNILLKLGAQGCVLIRLSTDVTSYKSVPTTSSYKPSYTMTSTGRDLEDGKKMGVVVQHFPIPVENENLEIVDVTGAGDALLGYLSSSILDSDWLRSDIESLEQEWGMWESIYNAQLASGKTITGKQAN